MQSLDADNSDTMEINRRLLDALLDLHRKKRSGILRIQQASVKKQLVLNDGLLVFAESNQLQEHLAQVMVALNLIPRAELNEIASLMKAGKTSEEAILSLSGLNIEHVVKARHNQAILIVSSLLGWDGWDLRLYSENGWQKNRLDLKMRLPDLILESVRQAVSKRIVRTPPHFFEGSFTASASSSGLDFPIDRNELEVCSLLKGGQKGADILQRSPSQEGKTEDTLLILYSLGLIQWTGPKSAGNAEDFESCDSNPLALRLEEMLARFMAANFYEVLSVKPDASPEEIQAVYHEHAKQLHPDRFQTNEFSGETRSKAEQVFAKINEAYLTLKNPASRAIYDGQLPKKKLGYTGSKAGAAQSAETAEGLYREGRQLLAKGDVETAVERLKGCVWLCPEKAVYYHYLGIAESKIPKFKKSAEQHFLKAIELEDVSADSHMALAKLYIDVRLPRKAEFQIEQVLRWEPHNAEARKLAADLKKLR